MSNAASESRPAASAGGATLVGLVAVLMWALLATLTTWTGDVPPLLLNALAFTVASVIGIAWVLMGDGPRGFGAILRQPWPVWLLGVGGLFGYHAMYFTALKLAPPVEASLIAYLWPLLIVLFSALLPGEALRSNHIVGAVLGFLGAGLIVMRAGEGADGRVLEAGFDADYTLGYLAALTCALIWSGYSVLSRLARSVPTQAVAGFCIATAVLSFALHLVFEETVWPQGLGAWLAVLALGLGPVGGAFYVWDWGCKRGDIKVLGAASYAAPVLSTLVLVLAGQARLTAGVVLACALVTLGAVVASWQMLRGRSG
ncbi:MAG: EamA family transporter [Pseudomonadota bacterium]